MGSSLRWYCRILLVVLGLGLLVSCTRERAVETPEAAGEADVVTAEEAAAPAEPEVTIVAVETPADASTPEPTATPTPEFATMPYTVQPGDTVSTVAEKFGTDSQTLREMNLLTTDNLQAGQMLRVPNDPDASGTEPDAAPTPSEPFEYVVQEGDTLLSIAIKFDVSPNEIVAANTLANPDSVVVGQPLIIPNYQPQAEATPAAVDPYQYVIQEGDTLFSIALQFGISADEIMTANDLTDPNTVVLGQTLLIPGYQPATETTAEAEPYEHVVQAGQTLFAIAQQYGVSADEIVAANSLSNPNSLTTGQALIIPGYQPQPAGATDATPGAETAQQATHVVADGETLFAIAQRYGVETQAIIDANTLSDPNVLQAGQELIIPGVTAAEVEAANQTIHVVAAGQSLNAIAELYGVTAQAIIEANEIDDPNLIQAGQRLTIPQE